MGSLRRLPSCPRGPASPSSVPSADIKQLYRLAGVDNKPTVFLFSDTQIADESFLEDINNVLSSGEVPNLYKPDEFVEVRRHRLATAPRRCSLACPHRPLAVPQVCNALADAARKDNVLQTPDSMFSYLIERVRNNLHVVLCMSPVGELFRLASAARVDQASSA